MPVELDAVNDGPPLQRLSQAVQLGCITVTPHLDHHVLQNDTGKHNVRDIFPPVEADWILKNVPSVIQGAKCPLNVLAYCLLLRSKGAVLLCRRLTYFLLKHGPSWVYSVGEVIRYRVLFWPLTEYSNFDGNSRAMTFSIVVELSKTLISFIDSGLPKKTCHIQSSASEIPSRTIVPVASLPLNCSAYPIGHASQR
jgi:hypothetical protein